MKRTILLSILLISALQFPGFLLAQHSTDKGLNSITEAELRDHIFFLASDYLNGRVATTPEYEIACRYVASQFAASGLKPLESGDSSMQGYFQNVPFAHTQYGDELNWTIKRAGMETVLAHKKDFKILYGSQLNFDNAEMVYVGYGIDEPTEKWNDFKDLDLKGKIAICLAGTPEKKGKPLFSKEINDKYSGQSGIYAKLMGGMMKMGAAGLILVDPAKTMGFTFEMVPSSFATEKTAFKGTSKGNSVGSIPSIYLVKSEFLDLIMGGMSSNPNASPDNLMKNYKTALLAGTTLSSKVEIRKEDEIISRNVIGIVPGTDPVLKNEYIVVGGHLDHVAPQGGKACNGADDNASGSAGVMEIAEAVAMNPCKRTVIFTTWTAEEMGLIGSNFFLQSGVVPKDQIKFNINMDMIGRTGKGNEATRAHYVVTDKKYLAAITEFINQENQGVTDFPILFDDDEHSPGGSDHMTFIQTGIPAFFFFSGIHADLHKPGDDAEKIDYPKAASISRLGYLLAEKLGNMDVVPAFK